MQRFVAWLSELSPLTVYLVIGLSTFAENVFPPTPSDLVVALGGFLTQRSGVSPIIAWLVAWLATPKDNVFHVGVHVLLVGLVIAATILFLKPKDYDAHDVEISGLYWHFVDLVWMFIFPLVYLMSTRITG